MSLTGVPSSNILLGATVSLLKYICSLARKIPFFFCKQFHHWKCLDENWSTLIYFCPVNQKWEWGITTARWHSQDFLDITFAVQQEDLEKKNRVKHSILNPHPQMWEIIQGPILPSEAMTTTCTSPCEAAFFCKMFKTVQSKTSACYNQKTIPCTVPGSLTVVLSPIYSRRAHWGTQASCTPYRGCHFSLGYLLWLLGHGSALGSRSKHFVPTEKCNCTPKHTKHPTSLQGAHGSAYMHISQSSLYCLTARVKILFFFFWIRLGIFKQEAANLESLHSLVVLLEICTSRSCCRAGDLRLISLYTVLFPSSMVRKMCENM